jgi:hypothetical protein
MYGLLTKSRELGLSASIRNYGDASIASQSVVIAHSALSPE